MFEKLFPHRATAARYHQAPFAAERQLYLSKLMEEGRSIETLRNIAWILIYVARHLPVHRAEITPTKIEAAAATWAMTTHRSATCLHIGKREFVFHATNWVHPRVFFRTGTREKGPTSIPSKRSGKSSARQHGWTPQKDSAPTPTP